MASKLTNQAVEKLRRWRAAEDAALEAVAAAGVAVRRAQDRRAAEVARWDAAVAEAEQGEDAALAVLALVLPLDRLASLTGATPARVRLAQQRSSGEWVSERVKELTGARPVRRRGRPPQADRIGGAGGGDRGAGVRRVSRDEQKGRERGGGDQGGGLSADGGVLADAEGVSAETTNPLTVT